MLLNRTARLSPPLARCRAISIAALLLIGAGCGSDVTNVSWTASEVTFDYHASRTCAVNFHYVFLDSSGSVLDEADTQRSQSVEEGQDYHETISAGDFDRIPDGTKSIDITPNCR